MAGSGAKKSGVDAVVDDVDPVGRHLEVREHVVARPLAHGDHRVRRLERGPLDPARQVVAAAELLALPRPQRLERVDGHHQRHRVRPLHQQARQVAVPGVAVDEVRVGRVGGHGQVAGEGLPGGAQPLVAGRQVARRRVAAAPAILPPASSLVAEGAHLDRDRGRAARASAPRRASRPRRRRWAGTRW